MAIVIVSVVAFASAIYFSEFECSSHQWVLYASNSLLNLDLLRALSLSLADDRAWLGISDFNQAHVGESSSSDYLDFNFPPFIRLLVCDFDKLKVRMSVDQIHKNLTGAV